MWVDGVKPRGCEGALAVRRAALESLALRIGRVVRAEQVG